MVSSTCCANDNGPLPPIGVGCPGVGAPRVTNLIATIGRKDADSGVGVADGVTPAAAAADAPPPPPDAVTPVAVAVAAAAVCSDTGRSGGGDGSGCCSAGGGCSGNEAVADGEADAGGGGGASFPRSPKNPKRPHIDIVFEEKQTCTRLASRARYEEHDFSFFSQKSLVEKRGNGCARMCGGFRSDAASPSRSAGFQTANPM